MKRQQAYSICDMMELTSITELPELDRSEIVYLGSYFCDRYFCQTPDKLWKQCFDLIKKRQKRAALVVPTPSQKQLADVKAKVQELAAAYPDILEEFVLNDYAMLAWAQEQYPEIKRWAGRLLSKETRDPRYKMPQHAAKLYERAVNNDLFELEVVGVEIDSVEPIVFQPSETCMLGIHLPYAYVSMGRICELGSIGMEFGQKFHLANSCSRQCLCNWIDYWHHEHRFIKHGRAVFTPNHHLKLPQTGFRVVYSALDDKLNAFEKGEF